MKQTKNISFLALVLNAFACSHYTEQLDLKKEPQQRLLKIPKNMVYVSRILVKRATPRKSPSLESSITDYVLKRNEKIIIHGKYKEWVKFFSISHQRDAWIHQAMISKPMKNRKTYMIPEKGLLKTKTNQDVYQAWSFHALESVPTKMKKGTSVYILMNKKNKALSWLPKEKKVLWLSQKTLDL